MTAATAPSPPASAGEDASAPPYSARDARFNFAILICDVTCFYIGIAFLDTSTALPALIARLGGTAQTLALLASLRQAGYYLPQLFVAHRLQGRDRYQPFLLKVCAFGRVWLFAAAVVVYLLGAAIPAAALGAVAAAYCLSWLGDGMGGVPWTAIVGRAVPADRRGRLFATTQVLTGIGRFGVGAAVRSILGERVVAFPASGALLVLGCAVFLALSWVFLALIREPAAPPATANADNEEPALLEADRNFWIYLRGLPERFRARPDIARLALAQILATAITAVAPFLLAQANRHTPGGLPESIAGTFLMVQTAGLLLCAPLLGWLTDRYGPRRTLLLLFFLAILSALFAVFGAVRSLSMTGALTLFCLSYFVLGTCSDSWSTLTNYLLEAVPEHHEQAAFIALMNASSAPVLVLPLLLGHLVRADGSATLAFAVAAGMLAVGLLVTISLPDTRRNNR